MTLRIATAAAASLGLAALGLPAFAQQGAAPADHPGRAVYQSVCAACHANPVAGSRAAQLASLQAMTPVRLREVMTDGVMKDIGSTLSPQQMTDVIAYLTFGQQQAPAQWTDAIACPADKKAVDTSKPVVSAGFGGVA